MNQRVHRPWLRRFLIGSIISTMVIAVVTVMFALYNADAIVRWTMLRRLCSTDQKQRQQAISFVIAHEDEPAVIAGVIAKLDGADAECFNTLVQTLAAAGQWGPNVGPAWLRYLQMRIGRGKVVQQAGIAVQLGNMLWLRQACYDDPRVGQMIEKLLHDDNADVRLNALSAAACLTEPARTQRLTEATKDTEPVIAARAARLLKMLHEKVQVTGPRIALDDAAPQVKQLAELESMRTNSVPLPFDDKMSDLVRLQTVRVSTTSTPADLMRVFESNQPTTRDLACVIAVQRFAPDLCRALAKDMVASFVDNQRDAGAILAGMVQPDEELAQFMNIRVHQGASWAMTQHYNLGLTMQGHTIDKFDSAILLANANMPRTTVTLALMQMGRLEGVDWMINPFGDPPVALNLLFDPLRYWPVLDHYFPQMPRFDLWTDTDTQKKQVELIRDWYLLFRPTLKFDPQKHVFISEAAP